MQTKVFNTKKIIGYCQADVILFVNLVGKEKGQEKRN
jgi:hypothetical protein